MDREYILIRKTTAFLFVATLLIAICVGFVVYGIINSCRPIPVGTTYVAKISSSRREEIIFHTNKSYELITYKDKSISNDQLGRYYVDDNVLYLFKGSGDVLYALDIKKNALSYTSNNNNNTFNKISSSWVSITTITFGSISGILSICCIYGYRKKSISPEAKRRRINKLQKQLDELNSKNQY